MAQTSSSHRLPASTAQGRQRTRYGMSVVFWLCSLPCLISVAGCTPDTTAGAGADGGVADLSVVVDGAASPDASMTGAPSTTCSSLLPSPGSCTTNLCSKQVLCTNGTTSVSGTVLAPTLPQYGTADPIFNAEVYVPNGMVAPLPAGAACDSCANTVSGSPLVLTTTGPDGKFVLSNVPCGNNIPLVIQLNRWRRQVIIPTVACCANTALPTDQTRLPRNHIEGDIPLMAIATGNADSLECTLLKMGIDSAEFTAPAAGGRVHLYLDNGGSTAHGVALPVVSTLYDSASTLANYHAVLFDCVGTQVDKSAAAKANVLAYANAGGRIYADHFSYVWLYNTPPFSATADWSGINQADPPNHFAFIDRTFAKGAVLSAWLTLVGASTNAGRLAVLSVHHDLNGVVPPGQQWIYADPAVSASTPIDYSFDAPVGSPPAKQCGRVHFGELHTTTIAGKGDFPGYCGAAAPMSAQEKALEFFLFDMNAYVPPIGP